MLLIRLLLILSLVRNSIEKPWIIFANRKDIRVLDGSLHNRRINTTILVKDLIYASALDINYAQGYVCYSDIETERIQCQFQDKKVTLVSSELPAPEDLVCDWLTNKLYWSDSETNRIEVVSMYPPYHRKVLIWEDIDQPRALALAPHLGYLFFSDWGELPKIERVGMNGEDRKVIVDKDIFWPNGLAIDFSAQKLYWVDAKLHYVAVVDFNGNNRKLINQGATLHPFSLAFYDNNLYWSDWTTNSLHTIRTDGTGLKQLSTKQNLTPMDIQIYEEQSIPMPIWGNNLTNPCIRTSGNCEKLCLLSPKAPFYNCACPIGIKLKEDGFTCESQINSFLLVARGNDIRRISLDTSDFTDVILPFNGIKHILAVDYHVKSGFIFWTDDEARRIRRAKLDGTLQMDVVKDEIVHPDGLAIDWIAENLYWTDAGTDRIEVARLDGKHRKILISRGLQEPRAISVDPGRGLLFWSDWGKKAKIEKSYLDGSGRQYVINSDIFWPNGLALDIENSKIYWCDAKTDKIEMTNYDGSNRKEIIGQDLPHNFGFSLLGDYIYWTDWQRRTIERANKFTGEERMTIKDPFSDPMGLKGVSMTISNVTNPCGLNNDGCAHLCLYRPQGPLCACASGYELEEDNKSCTIPEAFLIFSRDGDLHRISLNRSNYDDVIPVSKVKVASALDFDTIDNRIYWSDTKVKAISRAYMNGSVVERVVEWGLLNPEGIAVDWLSRNIYFSDLGRHRIEVAKLNGMHRRTIHWNIEYPKAITLHPGKGWLYWSMWQNTPTIEKSALDGSLRSVFISQVGRANGLTIDLEENYLYWTDIDSMLIERVGLNGERREIVVPSSSNFKPSSIAQYQDFIYWSDLNSQTILRANKSSNSTPTKLASALNIFDMTIYHKFKQPGWNPCSITNCSHLCFPIPSGKNQLTSSQCGCPTHYTLNDDGSTCIYPEQFLLLSGGTHITRLLMDTGECPDTVVIGGQKKIGSFAWDGRDKMLYWADLKGGNVKRGYENNTGFNYIFGNDEILKPFDLVFDPMRRILFWTCENFNSINITDQSSRLLGSILSGTEDRPRHLALNSLKSHIYFSNNATGSIERINIDGMDRQIVVEGIKSLLGLELDAYEEQLFWIDGNYIETSNINGINRKTLVSSLESPKSIAILGRYLYWIEENGSVNRVEKWSGEERLAIIPRTDPYNYIISINDSDWWSQHPCSKSICSHLCIETGCSCPEGLVLAEDKRNCIYKMPCGAHEFSCSRGSIGCIPLAAKCDGKPDCLDFSDEVDCGAGIHCGQSQYRCINGGQQICVHGSWQCDSDNLIDPDGPVDSSNSILTTIIAPLIIVIAALVGATIWYCFRVKSNLTSEESSDPLNPMSINGGTNMTTINTAESLFLPPTSSIGSSPYCDLLLVPHPSPATEIRSHSHCCHGNHGNYTMYYRGAPPPTPSSDLTCDNSIYAFAPPSSPHTSSSPHSTIRSQYNTIPPPPPSPT